MQKKTTIGGQALLEGIVMNGPRRRCIAVRKSDGTIETKAEDRTPWAERYPILKLPFLRGCAVFAEATADGMHALDYSAKLLEEEEEEEEPSRFEQWLTKHFGEKAGIAFAMAIASVFGVVFPLLLFFLLPALVVSPFGELPLVAKNLVEGLVRVCIFVLFMWGLSHMKDIKRTFCYHGAEHKTIFCYEKGLPLTVEHVKKQSRFHPRCGTSFLFVVIVISILVSSIVFSYWTPPNAFWRFVGHLVLLPVVVGLSYEVNRYAGRYDNWLTYVLRWPGIQMQHITVLEPEDAMIEVAIAAMKPVIPTDDSDAW